VKPAERVPLDGEVVRGTSEVNQAPITGESVLVPKEAGRRYLPDPSMAMALWKYARPRPRRTPLWPISSVWSERHKAVVPLRSSGSRNSRAFIPRLSLRSHWPWRFFRPFLSAAGASGSIARSYCWLSAARALSSSRRRSALLRVWLHLQKTESS